MGKPKQSPPEMEEKPVEEPRESPLSLSRLREAFAAMLGGGGQGSRVEGREPEKRHAKALEERSLAETAPRVCEINPRSVTEALLFVSGSDNAPKSARELAATMRGVSPAEIEAAIHELNALYDADETPYRIEQTNGGYRLVLRPEFERMRDKFYGKVKEARLSPGAIEVLSVLAYNQPATVDQLNELRGSPCGAALSTLVRRKLVRVDRAEADQPPKYSTTDRFLQLFNLESLSALPRSEELEKA